MTRTEHLLVIAIEECHEVAQRLSKALRFGMMEIQPGQPLTNRERIRYEYSDLAAVLEMIDPATDGAGGRIHPPSGSAMDAKREKVEHFLKYSAECGTLSDDPAAQAIPAPPQAEGTALAGLTAELRSIAIELDLHSESINDGLTETMARRLEKLADKFDVAAVRGTEAATPAPLENWRPIDTYKETDGYVFLWNVNGECLGAGTFDPSRSRWDFWCRQEEQTISPPPTHWMPRHQPPAGLAPRERREP